MSAWTVIAHTELGGNQGTITFSSIPQTYTDLFLVVSGRSTSNAAAWSDSELRPNGATTNLTNRFLSGSGSSAGSDTRTNWQFWVNGDVSTSNTFSNVGFYLPNYAGNTNKTVSIDSVQETNATAIVMAIVAGVWSQTTAISSLDLVTSGDWKQYTSATPSFNRCRLSWLRRLRTSKTYLPA
jgi:hypothetical protein